VEEVYTCQRIESWLLSDEAAIRNAFNLRKVKAANENGWTFSVDADRVLAARLGRDIVVSGPGGDAPGSWIPLRLAEGRESDQVVTDLVRQMESIADVLSAFSRSPPITVPAEVEGNSVD
jgi:hypothetical protein